MEDKTNYGQSVMHIVKCNLGAGFLAMPSTFAHTGLLVASIGFPLLAIFATYCVHLLIKSARLLETKHGLTNCEYAELAKGAFKAGPQWMRSYSSIMCKLVDATIIITLTGVCCVYLVFVAENITKILKTYSIDLPTYVIFMSMLPVALLLCYIRTLKRLAIASTCANLLQVAGITIILRYLIMNLGDMKHITLSNSFENMALGFGTAMFAFEGITVVLPVYSRMRNPKLMSGFLGVTNVSYIILFSLYFSLGLFGYLKFGQATQASITLNLPAELLYDIARGMFTVSLFLSYPLQFYVFYEIIWNWARTKVLHFDEDTSASKVIRYDYYGRTILVILTSYDCINASVIQVILASSVPMLDQLMGLVGSVSGAMLSIVLPPMIHIATFWEETSGTKRYLMVAMDAIVAIVGISAGSCGATFSVISILKNFKII